MKQSVSSHKLLALIKNNNVVILDVRSKDEFDRGHIFGSRNIPLDELAQRYGELPDEKFIVTYCGKGGGRSEKAARFLIESKRQSAWLEGGYLEWPFFASSSSNADDMVFYQLFEKDSSTYTYLLADVDTREAIIIDPVLETVGRDLALIRELGLKLLYILETHIHADHITGSDEIRKQTGAKSGVSGAAGVCCADLQLFDGQEIKFGRYSVKVLATPGHTSESLSFYCSGKIFTGDSLMIRGTGRTDFQQGSADELYESIHTRIFSLPGETKIFPAHDYNGNLSSTVDLEKQWNPRVGSGKLKIDFVQLMSEIKLDKPKKLHEAVPANLKCGRVRS